MAYVGAVLPDEVPLIGIPTMLVSLEMTMQTPTQIELEGVRKTPELQAAIDGSIAELERLFGRITACRIVVKGPGERHQTGGQHQVSVRLALPDGREVNVGRTPKQDERYADLTFAIDNAFKRARRRLQDQARLMRGQTKVHEGQLVGTVVRIDPSGEFGFLESADGHEVYFNFNSVLNGGSSSITPGTRVHYVEEIGAKGAQASTVKVLGKHGLRV
ncbi:HPF/RaiA family ribosome-associated protein [Bradyrhizobium sp.]|uniref:HPF/RaiA family ribosome-associated protein n=1 Tax=Bradyrhizobium sp. TaxID=376 RepID=UPI00261B1F2B|nr:HPF/RaiA family ribosome-associated protein [Bradyrhizobium sp.]